MRFIEALDFRKIEEEKRKALREQVRVVYGSIRVTGTGTTSTITPSLPFGAVRFMEKPHLTSGFNVNSGTVDYVTLGITQYSMDKKSLYDSCKFKVYVSATGAYDIDVFYQLQGKCHMLYTKSGV